MRRSAFFVLAAVAFDLGPVGNAFSGDFGGPPVYTRAAYGVT